MRRREELAGKILNAISESNLSICPELCFLSLYDLPPKLQLILCIGMLKRYLDIFENRNGNIKGPRILLNEVEYWAKMHRMIIEGQDADLCPADNAFMYGLESLLFACINQERKDLLSTSCATGITSVINAFGANVWQADDPICVKKWQEGELISKEATLRNVASIAVESREWEAFVSLIEQNNVYSFNDSDDVNEMNRVLKEWKDNEMLLLMHKVRKVK